MYKTVDHAVYSHVHTDRNLTHKIRARSADWVNNWWADALERIAVRTRPEWVKTIFKTLQFNGNGDVEFCIF